MSEPTPSIDVIRKAYESITMITTFGFKPTQASWDTVKAALDELAALRAQVAEQREIAERAGMRVMELLAEKQHVEAQLVQAHAWRSRAEPYLYSYANDSVIRFDSFGLWGCTQCGAVHRLKAELVHKPHCETLQARTLLGEGGQ